ncbi:MAG TPA: hypothetical protein VF624_11045 [Tepidisphaeraceae bacterium]|jgi:hypothetical protein
MEPSTQPIAGMSPLEIVKTVSAIISPLLAIWAAIQTWKKNRAERDKAAEAKKRQEASRSGRPTSGRRTSASEVAT